MKQGNKKPKFFPGQSVLDTNYQKERKVKGEAKWNGSMFVYSFEDTDMRCGEMYLRKVSTDDIPTDLFKSSKAN